MKLFISHPSSNNICLNDEHATTIELLQEIEDGSCLSINLNNVLDYLIFKDRAPALALVASKLRYGAELKMNGIDILVIANHIENSLMTIEDINSMLLSGRFSSDSINPVINYLKDLGLRIDLSKQDGFQYTILATRPAPDEQ